MRGIRRSAVGISGIVASVLLHSGFLAVAIWGHSTTETSRPYDAFGAGATRGSAPGESELRTIVIQLHTQAASDEPMLDDVAHLLEPATSNAMLEITGPDSLPAEPLESTELSEDAERSDADLVARTQLAGLYEGQIRARIERAWNRPSEVIAESEFNCRIKISQARTGQVQTVELQRCNGSPVWQESLAMAVFAASPLPAPPDPAVYVDAFSLVFTALGMRGATAR